MYGSMIMFLAENETEIIKLIQADDLGPLMLALREHIEKSPIYE